MPTLKVLRPGLMTSIQDIGRPGLAYYAIPRSGCMDPAAARLALLLLGEDETKPLLEITSLAPHLEFLEATRMVLTGVEFGWTLNDLPVQLNTVHQVQTGDVLRGGPARTGLRGYLALEGTLRTNTSFHSAATYAPAGFGGNQGRLLRRGDVLSWENNLPSDHFELLPGPEFDRLNPEAVQQLANTVFRISPQSSRMGVRLLGTPLPGKVDALTHSVPVLPGFVQLPPDGVPIVVLQDGQTTGGYPRIAYLRERYLGRLNQIPLGGELRFWIG